MLTKSELIKLWKQYGFRPIKRLGQNFLIDKNIKDKILRHLELDSNNAVIEIGSGFGELTLGLSKLSKKVFAVEKDKSIVRILKDAVKLPGNVTVIEGDFLDIDLKKIAGNKKVTIYGNLPYYITSPIIEKLIENISCIRDIYLVVQKEVGERMVAKPNSKDIGRLSLYVQYHTNPLLQFKISRGSFYPMPQVDSVFLKLDVRKNKKVRVKNERILFELIKKAYSQRRKTVLNSLAGPGLEKDKLRRLLQDAKINPSARPETLSLEDFSHLSNLL